MPIERKVKIRKASSNTTTPIISLPSDWLRFNNLTYKDEVKILGNGILVIVPSNRPDLEQKAREFVEGRMGDKKCSFCSNEGNV